MLTDIQITYCMIDDRFSFIAEALTTNMTIKNLNFSNNQIGYIGLVALAKALHQNNTLIQINLNTNRIGRSGTDDAVVDALQKLADALSTNKTLTFLDIGSNGIKTNGAIPLVNALFINDTLIKLNLASNDIKKENGIEDNINKINANAKRIIYTFPNFG